MLWEAVQAPIDRGKWNPEMEMKPELTVAERTDSPLQSFLRTCSPWLPVLCPIPGPLSECLYIAEP